MIAKGSLTLAFAINLGTFAVFSWTLSRIRLVSVETTRPANGGLITAVVEGWRYAAGHVGLGAMFLTLTVVSLCIRPVLELMPSYAALFGPDAGKFAFMTSVIGLAAAVLVVLLAHLSGPVELPN